MTNLFQDGFELTLESLVYVLRNCNNEKQVLMQYRYKDPFKDLWVPLGKQIGRDESPYAAAVKILDNNGIFTSEIQLRGVVTEICPDGSWQCFLFIYVVPSFTGDIHHMESSDGCKKWFPVEELTKLDKPIVDANFNLDLLLGQKYIYQSAMMLDRLGNLVEVREYGKNFEN